MSWLGKILGIEKSVEQTVKRTLQEAYPLLPGVPASSMSDWFSMRPDQDGFLPVGVFRRRNNRGDNPQAYLHDEDLRRSREISRDLSVSNEYARNGLTNRQNYIVGTGFKVTAEPVDPDAPNEALVKQVNEWLQRYAALTKRSEKEKESVKRGDRDGDVFLRLRKKDVLDFIFIEPEYVGDWDGETPFGIKTDPQDITKVISYLVKQGDGAEVEVVPADEIIHVKLNTDSGIKRGLPFLFPVFSILRKIESTNENMATNVAIMASIAMIRRNQYMGKASVDSNNSSTADFQTTGPTGTADNYRVYRAGTIIDTDANTEYEFPANGINLKGVVDVKQSLLQTAAAGMGLPEYMLTSDASNGNFASTQVAETPAIAGFLAMQDFWGDVFGKGMWVEGAEMGLTWRAIQYAVEQGQLPEQVLADITLKCEGPSIEVRDKAAETDRHLKLAEAGIISRDKVAKHAGETKAHKSDAEVKAEKDAELQSQMALKTAGKSIKEEFDEEKHPRDGDGKFANKGGDDKKNTSNEGGKMFDHKGHYFRIQPKGKNIAKHRSEDSAGEFNTLHVFEDPYYTLAASEKPTVYGDEVVAIKHTRGHQDNGDVEGVGIVPDKDTKIVKRWSLRDFIKEFFPTAAGDDDSDGIESWHRASRDKTIDASTWEKLRTHSR